MQDPIRVATPEEIDQQFENAFQGITPPLPTSPKVQKPKGYIVDHQGKKYVFKSGTTPEQIEKALGANPQQLSQPQVNQSQLNAGRGDNPLGGDPSLNRQLISNQSADKVIDFLRPIIAGTVGTGATALTSPLELAPGLGTAANILAGTQAYTATDVALKYLKTDKPKDFTQAFTDSEKDSVFNYIAGKLISSVWKGAQAIRNANMPENFLGL